MSVSYFKRFRMEIDLRGQTLPIRCRAARLSAAGLAPELLADHAEAKYHSFRHEIDADVFNCLAELDGCHADAGDQPEGRLPARGDWLALTRTAAKSSTAARSKAFARRTSTARFRTSASRRRIAGAASARR